MPEYPDIVVYIERLQALVKGQTLQKIHIAHPFLLRTAAPPIHAIEGLAVRDIERMGKRIVFAFADDYFHRSIGIQTLISPFPRFPQAK